MNVKQYIEKHMNLQPDEGRSYSGLYAIALKLPNAAEVIRWMAASLAAELDEKQDAVSVTNVTIPPLRPGQWVKVGGAAKADDNDGQKSLMKYDPGTGQAEPYPSDAGQYRKYHGSMAWLFNPWTGNHRNPFDIGTDTTGLLITECSDD